MGRRRGQKRRATTQAGAERSMVPGREETETLESKSDKEQSYRGCCSE